MQKIEIHFEQDSKTLQWRFYCESSNGNFLFGSPYQYDSVKSAEDTVNSTINHIKKDAVRIHYK